MTPREPTGRNPGRQPYDDPATVRSVVRSTRFTPAEDVLIAEVAGAGGVAAWLHDAAIRAAKRQAARRSKGTGSPEPS